MFCSFSCIYIWSCCTLKIQFMLNYLCLWEKSETLMAMFWYLSMPIKTNCTVGALGGASCRCPPVPVQNVCMVGAGEQQHFTVASASVAEPPACPWMWEMRWRGCKGALGKVLFMAEDWENAAALGHPLWPVSDTEVPSITAVLFLSDSQRCKDPPQN